MAAYSALHKKITIIDWGNTFLEFKQTTELAVLLVHM